MKYPYGHQADSALTRDEVQRQKWCRDCDPAHERAHSRERQINREAERRNLLTQASLDAIGMGQFGPLANRR